MEYPVDTLTDAERDRLRPHVTNLDRPVFALVNLPETVKGALFARYSRYPGTLRRLFLDEFAGDLPDGAAAWAEITTSLNTCTSPVSSNSDDANSGFCQSPPMPSCLAASSRASVSVSAATTARNLAALRRYSR